MNVIITATRHCARCDNDLPLEAFNGSQRYCAPCSALSRKEWSARQRSKSSAVISGATSAPGINETAAAETIASLRANHELHPVDADRAATLVSLARSCDIEPGNSSLWACYQRAQVAIRVRRVEDVAATKAARSSDLIQKIRGAGPHPLTQRPAAAAPRATKRETPLDASLLPAEAS